MHRFILAAALALSAIPMANAATYGPYQDAQATVGPFTDPTGGSGPTSIVIIIDSRLRDFTDHIEINIPWFTTAHVLGVAYVQTSASDPNVAEVTTIYGHDLNPPHQGPSTQPSMAATGFDPINPEVLAAANETFISPSNIVYDAHSIQARTLADLPGLFSDPVDLSPFSGDPSGIFYVFQTTLPASVIPEPASLGLLSLGAVALLRRRRHV